MLLSWLPFFHDMGLIYGVIQPLFKGIPAVLLSPVSFLQKPLRFFGMLGVVMFGAGSNLSFGRNQDNAPQIDLGSGVIQMAAGKIGLGGFCRGIVREDIDLVRAVYASCALPVYFPPADKDGDKLVAQVRPGTPPAYAGPSMYSRATRPPMLWPTRST